MTGYGRATCTTPSAQVTVTVQSLNAKTLEINFRLPKLLGEQELAWRKTVAAVLTRGKVNVGITYEPLAKATTVPQIDEAAFVSYYQQLDRLAAQVRPVADNTLFSLAIQAVRNGGGQEATPDTLPAAEIAPIATALEQALVACQSTRQEEGAVLAEQLMSCHATIQQHLEQVVARDPARLAQTRATLRSRLEELELKSGLDENRFEQELIYYLEKLDIAEEKVRLNQHLTYFDATLQQEELAGKKLGFIVQEMGREINTIGSKANDAAMQQHVVQMKDALGQMKEQLANVL